MDIQQFMDIYHEDIVWNKKMTKVVKENNLKIRSYSFFESLYEKFHWIKPIKHKCFDKNLLITAIGDHIIRMIPPLILTKEDCDKAANIICESVKELAA